MAQPKLSRRKFILAVGAGGAAGVAAVAATKKLGSEATATQSAEKKRKGYELSEHVRKYYRTTLV